MEDFKSSIVVSKLLQRDFLAPSTALESADYTIQRRQDAKAQSSANPCTYAQKLFTLNTSGRLCPCQDPLNPNTAWPGPNDIMNLQALPKYANHNLIVSNMLSRLGQLLVVTSLPSDELQTASITVLKIICDKVLVQ